MEIKITRLTDTLKVEHPNKTFRLTWHMAHALTWNAVRNPGELHGNTTAALIRRGLMAWKELGHNTWTSFITPMGREVIAALAAQAPHGGRY